MSVQLQGNSATVAEVDSASRALRATLRPNDPGALGAYQKALVSGTMTAALAANSPVYSFRYGGANVCKINRVRLTLGDITAMGAGAFTFSLFVARVFTASDTGGTGGTLTGNNAK